MLIVFDLDDTLIDTFGSIIPVVLKTALKKIRELDEPIKNFNAAYQDLIKINMTAIDTKDALKIFFEKYQLKKSIYTQIAKELNGFIPNDLKIKTLKNVPSVLKKLKLNNTLAVVTKGKKKWQLFKMEKAGIDTSIFSKIIVTERDKEESYKKIINAFNKGPQEVIVIGDRIKNDLAPAKKLGCRTIHMKWGRGKLLEKTLDVDFAVDNFEELEKIITEGKI